MDKQRILPCKGQHRFFYENDIRTLDMVKLLLDRLKTCLSIFVGAAAVKARHQMRRGVKTGMNDALPPCPECASTFTYDDGTGLLNCPECGHSWSSAAQATPIVRDAVGNPLSDGDTVTIVKDLKVGNNAIKVGTKVKNIRLLPPEQHIGDHDIDAKVPGFGPMGLKSSVVKKVAD